MNTKKENYFCFKVTVRLFPKSLHFIFLFTKISYYLLKLPFRVVQ